MYRDYRGLFCINGNLLHTAGKRAKDRIKEAVDDLLWFLRRSRIAENASPGNPKLALQVGIAYSCSLLLTAIMPQKDYFSLCLDHNSHWNLY